MIGKVALFSILAILIAIYFSGDALNSLYDDEEESGKPLMFTTESLSEFNGKISPKLYLSIMGLVFDVSKGMKHYGPGASYNFFIGKDTTRNFVDGNFECKQNCDDVTGLSSQELRSLMDWVKFYKNNYDEVGKLIGKYYDIEGNPTPYAKNIHKLIERALKEETEEDRLKLKYPGCNMEWNYEQGTHVWCTDQSGGIKRNWIGVPRKFFSPGAKDHRCACVREQDINSSNMKEYEGCDSKSTECFFKQ
ncbi:neuferricin homolog [Coccinella septempunctata]|uniref:neuferricin homolog n=1 Tax=Coccinella septempunctata TaxID=41139 RepID=UPI001D07720B|nr:neuferricin homolog [Coccinella septempunctata]